MERPKWEVADIFRRYREAYRQQHDVSLSTAQRRVMTAIEVCRTAATFSRTFALLGPAITEKIHERVLGMACEQGVAEGRKLRTDTPAVETNVPYPTDSTLLGDGIRVLSRGLKRIALEVVNHGRAVKYRLLEISRAAKSQTQASRRRMRDSYHQLLALTRKVVRQARRVVDGWTNEGCR